MSHSAVKASESSWDRMMRARQVRVDRKTKPWRAELSPVRRVVFL